MYPLVYDNFNNVFGETRGVSKGLKSEQLQKDETQRQDELKVEFAQATELFEKKYQSSLFNYELRDTDSAAPPELSCNPVAQRIDNLLRAIKDPQEYTFDDFTFSLADEPNEEFDEANEYDVLLFDVPVGFIGVRNSTLRGPEWNVYFNQYLYYKGKGRLIRGEEYRRPCPPGQDIRTWIVRPEVEQQAMDWSRNLLLDRLQVRLSSEEPILFSSRGRLL